MKEKRNKINRRNFLKTIGVAGLGSVFASSKLKADPNEPNKVQKTEESKFPELPRRKLGKTGIEIPVLSNGLMFDITENQLILRANLQHNITYWDTAYGYAGGNSEVGIGTFLKKNPEVRQKLFIVTKASGANTREDNAAEQLEQRLQESLKRMNIDYIDMYYGIHGCDNPDSQLSEQMQKWAESAKKRKLIRLLGFSTHTNMGKCLMAASKLNWIDAIMTSYNVALMQKPQMQEAVQACHEAGIGLIAMKVLLGVQKKQAEAEDKMVTHFLEKGYTREQALIKAVLEDKRITTACIRMENVTLLRSNIAAVLDKTSLTQADADVFRKYAAAACSGYCTGCAYICDAALPDAPYTSDIMRYLMYYNSYGEQKEARELFAQIPGNVRNKLLSTDYSPAEARCPQHLPIGKLITEAVSKLA
ncbi:MAG: aldo/keto reductase [Sedimentisphaerales bacterium]